MQRFFVTAIAVLAVACSSTQVEAGIGKWLAKGAQSLGRKIGLVGKEGVEASVKKSASKAPVVVRKAATGTGSSKFRSAASPSGRASAAAASSLDKVSRYLGKGGVTAMAKLSPSAGKKFAEISPLIAKSPHKEGWVSLLHTHGDECAEWLWKHRKSVAVASIGTGVALHPDAFTQMVSSGVESAGAHVIEPMIEGVLATPGKNGLSVWGWSMINGLLLGGFFWWRFRRK